jgi:hypothetical protein
MRRVALEELATLEPVHQPQPLAPRMNLIRLQPLKTRGKPVIVVTAATELRRLDLDPPRQAVPMSFNMAIRLLLLNLQASQPRQEILMPGIPQTRHIPIKTLSQPASNLI